MRETRAWFLVSLPWRAEYVENASTVRSGPETVRDTAGGTPEISGLHGMLFPSLDANAIAFKKYAPLFFRMAVDLTFSVRLERYKGEHGMIPDEDARA